MQFSGGLIAESLRVGSVLEGVTLSGPGRRVPTSVMSKPVSRSRGPSSTSRPTTPTPVDWPRRSAALGNGG